METSRHTGTDTHGLHYAVDIISTEDDLVVFESIPPLSYDFKKHGVRIKRGKHCDYVLTFVLQQKRLFFRAMEARLPLLGKKKPLCGTHARRYENSRWSVFRLDDIPFDYTGTLIVGKDFDFRFWKHDEKAVPVPFSPKVYKKRGLLRIENGIVMEIAWNEKSGIIYEKGDLRATEGC